MSMHLVRQNERCVDVEITHGKQHEVSDGVRGLNTNMERMHFVSELLLYAMQQE